MTELTGRMIPIRTAHVIGLRPESRCRPAPRFANQTKSAEASMLFDLSAAFAAFSPTNFILRL
jgi:hypothetical protein